MQSRLAAARVIQAVRRGASLNRALPDVLTKTDANAHATIQALSYGVLRRYELIEALLTALLKKPLKRKDEIVTDLLRVALFELLDSAKPDYAVVDSIVGLVKHERRWASGLANGVLRRFLRERESLVQTALEQPSARYLLPDWLLGKLRKAWPDYFEDLASALAEPAPMILRVDLSRVERQVYLQRLETLGIQATPSVNAPSGIVLQSACDIRQLPGFDDGVVSVQDAAAQLAGWLLDLKPGQRILDACAAPGGKTVHILEQTDGEAEVVAVEYETGRIARLEENLQRSGYAAKMLVADAGCPDGWWDGVLYDRILLDAPCSATGVIRRHPDIKRHRQPDDIPALVKQQARLLDSLWPLLKPGGLLLYATCSVLPEENAAQINDFLAAHDDCREVIIEADWGHAVAAGRQILPGEDAMDGFFYALLGKNGGAPDGQVKTVN